MCSNVVLGFQREVTDLAVNLTALTRPDTPSWAQSPARARASLEPLSLQQWKLLCLCKQKKVLECPRCLFKCNNFLESSPNLKRQYPVTYTLTFRWWLQMQILYTSPGWVNVQCKWVTISLETCDLLWNNFGSWTNHILTLSGHFWL